MHLLEIVNQYADMQIRQCFECSVILGVLQNGKARTTTILTKKLQKSRMSQKALSDIVVHFKAELVLKFES